MFGINKVINEIKVSTPIVSAAETILMCDGMQELLIVRFITLPSVMRWMP